MLFFLEKDVVKRTQLAINCRLEPPQALEEAEKASLLDRGVTRCGGARRCSMAASDARACVAAYICSVAPAVLAIDVEDVDAALQKLVAEGQDESGQDPVRAFGDEENVRSLVVSVSRADGARDVNRDGEEDTNSASDGSTSGEDGIEDDAANSPVVVSFSSGVKYDAQSRHVLVLVKKSSAPIKCGVPVGKQVTVSTLDSAQLVHSLYDMVHHSIHPLFTSYVESAAVSDATDGSGPLAPGGAGTGLGHRSSSSGTASTAGVGAQASALPAAQQTLKQLEQSLRLCQDAVTIGKVVLDVVPEVATALRAAGSVDALTVERIDEVVCGNCTSEHSEQQSRQRLVSRISSRFSVWGEEMTRLCKFTRDVDAGSSVQEIEFWVNLASVVKHVEEQLDSAKIQVCRKYLEVHGGAPGRRVVLAFIHKGSMLRENSKRIDGCATFLSGIPVASFMAASSLQDLIKAVVPLLRGLRRITVRMYDLQRFVMFARVIARDAAHHLIRMLSAMDVLHASEAELTSVSKYVAGFVSAWNRGISGVSIEFDKIQDGMARTERVTFAPPKVMAELSMRWNRLVEWIRNHHALCTAVKTVSDGAEGELAPAEEEVKGVFDFTVQGLLKGSQQDATIPVAFDTSAPSEQAYRTALSAYSNRVDRVEVLLTDRLRALLKKSSGAADMLKLLTRFSAAIFARKRVRDAVRQFQGPLLKSAFEDIVTLRERLRRGYLQSRAQEVSTMRGISTLTGQIVWVVQIRKQLQVYLDQVRTILGGGGAAGRDGVVGANGASARSGSGDVLDEDADFIRVQREGEELLRLLKPETLVEEWKSRTKRYRMSDTHSVLCPVQTKLDQITSLGLSPESVGASERNLGVAVNFIDEEAKLMRETAILTALGFRFEVDFMLNTRRVRTVYPQVVAFREALRSLYASLHAVETVPCCRLLLSDAVARVKDYMVEGMCTSWSRVAVYAKSFPEDVAAFAANVTQVLQHVNRVEDIFRRLMTAPFPGSIVYEYGEDEDGEGGQQLGAYGQQSREKQGWYIAPASTFQDILDELREQIDTLSLNKYACVDRWVVQLDQVVGDIFVKRLNGALASLLTTLYNDSVVESRLQQEEEPAPLLGWITKLAQSGHCRYGQVYLGREEVRDGSSSVGSTRSTGGGANMVAGGVRSGGADSKVSGSSSDGRVLRVSPIERPVVSVVVEDDVIRLTPGVMVVAGHVYASIDMLVDSVLSLDILSPSRYRDVTQAADATAKVASVSFAALADMSQLTVLPHLLTFIARDLDSLRRMGALWTRGFQFLFDMSVEFIVDYVTNGTATSQSHDEGTDDGEGELRLDEHVLPRWDKLFVELKRNRRALDSPRGQSDFACSILSFQHAQGKIVSLFSERYKALLRRFSLSLATSMRAWKDQVRGARDALEAVSFEESSAVDQRGAGCEVNGVVVTIATVRHWEREVERLVTFLHMFRNGEDTLTRNRFTFPSDWSYVELLEGEWSAMTTILNRRSTRLSAELPRLKGNLISEMRRIKQHESNVLEEWNESKPVGGDVEPQAALDQLAVLSAKLEATLRNVSSVVVAAKAMSSGGAGGMDPEVHRSLNANRIEAALQEAKDIASVWNHLVVTQDHMDKIYDLSWAAATVQDIKKLLEAARDHLRGLPSFVRRYDGYMAFLSRVSEWTKSLSLIGELKSDAFKLRHWTQLFKRLGLGVGSGLEVSSLTMRQFWHRIAPLRNEKLIREVLAIAVGEKGLENFLQDVKDLWAEYKVQLVLYYGNSSRSGGGGGGGGGRSVSLISGWEDLFGKLREHCDALLSMRASPYYLTFEDAAARWEDRLNMAHGLLSDWMEVQRLWVYLEGLFGANQHGVSVVQQLLPQESSMFFSVDSTFRGLARRVDASPLVLDIIAIDSIGDDLKKLSSILVQIQKGLGDYLERQRRVFPRFYFVGDGDLLEIVGSGSGGDAIPKVQPHLKKMFAGVASLTLSDDGNQIVGVISAQGETLLLAQAIDTNCAAYEWLPKLELALRFALLLALDKAVRHLESVKCGTSYSALFCASWTSFTAEAASAAAVSGGQPDAVDGDVKEALDHIVSFVETHCVQCVVLGLQILWTRGVERALESGAASTQLAVVREHILAVTSLFAVSVLRHDLPYVTRLGFETALTELVHMRDVTEKLMNANVVSSTDLTWLYYMRYYYDTPAKRSDIEMTVGKGSEHVFSLLEVRVMDASFVYGFEYMGACDRLVTTPLTDRTFVTLTQALQSRIGGSPFGPAGTGKTETVKQLGACLGRLTLVFCCDDKFDFKAMGRIFVGLCMCGAWGCFDEFNRLQEVMLSAVSQQIQSIQLALRSEATEVELLGKRVPLLSTMAMFVTMNPGYAGRSHLPENLKMLFRQVAMIKPDWILIAEVMLYNRGFESAKMLASKVGQLFELCTEQLSQQSHYDFGLRALKGVLVSAGKLKRSNMELLRATGEGAATRTSEEVAVSEQRLIVEALAQSVFPRLVGSDARLLIKLVDMLFWKGAFDDVLTSASSREGAVLLECIHDICAQSSLVAVKSWVSKIVQLHAILQHHHGIMLVGPAAVGKSSSWRVLFAAYALARERLRAKNLKPSWWGFNGTDDDGASVAAIVSPKSISKEELFGTLDDTTREWTDGLFTHLLRDAISDRVDSQRGRSRLIVFDGDTDAGWVENMNALLDDNKLLTLPNGERLALPSNVRIIFEVSHLRHATLATVSRCAMVWYSHGTLPSQAHVARALAEMPAQVASILAGNKRVAAQHQGAAASGDVQLSSKLCAEYVRIHHGAHAKSRTLFGVLPVESLLRGPFRVSAVQESIALAGQGAKGTVVPAGGAARVDDANEGRDAGADDFIQAVLQTLGPLCGTDKSGVPFASSLLNRILSRAAEFEHIMEWSLERGILTAFSLLAGAVSDLLVSLASLSDAYDNASLSRVEGFVRKAFVWACVWAVGGALSLSVRTDFARVVPPIVGTSVELPSGIDMASGQTGSGKGDDATILSYLVDANTCSWVAAATCVPSVEVEAKNVAGSNAVVPTSDTVRHRACIHQWIAGGHPLILCGPAGSGKSMTLSSTLQSLPNVDLVTLSFSSTSHPVLEVLEKRCSYKKTSRGVVLAPSSSSSKWLIVFCDEINLPAPDEYGTQRVISLLRTLVEQRGFFRCSSVVGGSDSTFEWVSLERVLFVGACNPPTDPGRSPLHLRFLRHAPVLFVDFPSQEALRQIYGTFSRALVRSAPAVPSDVASQLTNACVDVYLKNQARFTPDVRSHYVYSPRELSRWYRALREALLADKDEMTLPDLIRLWAHEGIRLFSDRLVDGDDVAWCESMFEMVAKRHFPVDVVASALVKPILYSTWLSTGSKYSSVDADALREYVTARLVTFYEEELDVPVVLFDCALDHLLRIDRVLTQPGGHVLLIGVSGGGKTLLSRFVAWMRGYEIFQVNVTGSYSPEDFDNDLRHVMMKAALPTEEGRHVVFLFDESNIVHTSFLERMNALLASGEVPGLFDADDHHATLMHALRAHPSLPRLIANDEDAMLAFFRERVEQNLHVVFTMNPAGSSDFEGRSATSPALFNRCVIDWYGDWPVAALHQAACELIASLDLSIASESETGCHKVQATTVHRMMPAGVPATLAAAYDGTSGTSASARREAAAMNVNLVSKYSFRDVVVSCTRVHVERTAYRV